MIWYKNELSDFVVGHLLFRIKLYDIWIEFSRFLMQLIFEIGPYLEELTKTSGVIKEFVNPK